MPPSLGTAFGGNFVLLDDEHTETVLQKHLLTLQLQLEPTHIDELNVVQGNCLTAAEHLRSSGFRMPTSVGKRVICIWCWKSRACNSSSLQAHLTTCSVCPESTKSRYRKAATESKSAKSFFGAQQLASARQAQQQAEVSSPQPSRVAAHEPVSPATTAVGSSSAQPDAGSHKRPAALLKPTTLFSSTALETTPLAITCEEMDGTAVTDARVADALTAPAVDQNEITQRLARFRMARQQRIGIAQQQHIVFARDSQK